MLDDILKPDIGQDAFQKELEDSATNEGTSHFIHTKKENNKCLEMNLKKFYY